MAERPRGRGDPGARTAVGETATQTITVDVVNSAPRAIIAAPLAGVVYRGVTVTLSGYGLDANEGPGPEDGVLNFCTWTSDSLTTEGPGVGCSKPVTFAANGTRTITLTVVDSQGLTGQATVALIVEDPPTNLPPTPSFVVSGSGPPYDWQTVITFYGSATDPEGNTPFTYHWTATALSDTGVVQGTPVDLGTTATATWTPYDNYAFFFGSGACQVGNGQRVRVTFAVTDSAGQTGTTVQEVRVVCTPG
ncbi:MAG TPA: hypothetical protein VGQ83_42880 [Polyangia bacterium]